MNVQKEEITFIWALMHHFYNKKWMIRDSARFFFVFKARLEARTIHFWLKNGGYT